MLIVFHDMAGVVFDFGLRFPQESKSRGRSGLLVPWKYWYDVTDFTGERVPPWQWLPLQKAIFCKYMIAIMPVPQDTPGVKPPPFPRSTPYFSSFLGQGTGGSP